MGILKQAESGAPISELCREHGMSNSSFYKWRAKFGGMDASMIMELKAMADAHVCRDEHARRLAEGKPLKAVATRGVSIALACRTFQVR